MFAILMAVANVGTGIGLGASGALVDLIGFRLTFAVVAVLNIFVLPMIPGIFRKPAQTDAIPSIAK
jgi:predicted MFS family arabinose efflux permease